MRLLQGKRLIEAMYFLLAAPYDCYIDSKGLQRSVVDLALKLVVAVWAFSDLYVLMVLLKKNS